MKVSIPNNIEKHILFSYLSFDRVILRGYIQGLYIPGSVIRLLRNLGFNKHSNGVMKLLTDQLNSHIKKTAEKLDIKIHWWSKDEKENYNSKIDFIKSEYKKQLAKKNKKSKVIAIIRAFENTRTFTSKDITTKQGKKFTKMYAVNKFVSQYYIYIDDEVLGLCYLKIASYLPYTMEFYFNGHNYLKKQLDNANVKYTMKDNSFTKIQDIELLKELVNDFKPSSVLKRIKHWTDMFFKFDKGQKSTRSKLLKHNWFTYQTEISTNLIFKSTKFANKYFDRILSKHHTIGLPDRLTEIFALSKSTDSSKTTQNKYKTKAVIKHWLRENSIKLYNKSGCLLRVETTINRPELPGSSLEKPAIHLLAYYRFGLSSNNRYLQTIADIDIRNFDENIMNKYQQPVINKKGKRIPAPDLRKPEQMQFIQALLQAKYVALGFKTKDLKKILGKNWKTAKIAYELRKLRERNAVKKLQNTHYYRLTTEGYQWIFLMIFQNQHFTKPLLSDIYKKAISKSPSNPDKIEQAYHDIKNALPVILKDFGLVA